jgi:hypothetical protein
MGYKGNLTNFFPKWLETIPDALMIEVSEQVEPFALAAAKRECPVGEPPEDKHPGFMRDHIESRIEKAPGIVKVIIGIKDAVVKYATIIAYGNKKREGNPFMEIARDQTMVYIKKSIGEMIRGVIKKAKEKAA